MLLERLLRKPVEGERRDGAFEMRSAKAPGAMRAAPAREVVAVDPDQAFTHTSAFVFVDSSAVAAGVASVGDSIISSDPMETARSEAGSRGPTVLLRHTL